MSLYLGRSITTVHAGTPGESAPCNVWKAPSYYRSAGSQPVTCKRCLTYIEKNGQYDPATGKRL